MWGLRILNGPQAGEVHPLKPGLTIRIGRAPTCQVILQGNGISKEHVELKIIGDKVTMTDLHSANGTYLNGVRAKAGFLKLGDKMLVSQIMMDIVVLQKRNNLPATVGSHPSPMGHLPADYNPQDMMVQAPPQPQVDFGTALQGQVGKVQDYIDRVAMPGVYRLPEVFEFRFVLMGFVGAYCLLLTLLSLFPLNQITSESILIESKRRALTVGRSLSEINQRVLRSGDYAGFRTDMIMKEEGIEDAYVISRDGKILAPPERIGFSPKDAWYVSKIKNSVREMAEEAIDGRIVASVPIVAFDAEIQQNVPKAQAVVVYNPGNLKFDEGRALSMFVQMLTLALAAGLLLYFLMYKLIEYPFKVLHKELDDSLREGRDQITIKFNFPALQNLLTSLNSMLTRVANGQSNQNAQVGKGSRDTEIANIMQLIGYPSLLIRYDGPIARVSPQFEALTEIPAEKLINFKIDDIPNPAMQQNINHLISQAQNNLSQIFSDTLEIGGHPFTLNCQALANASGDIEYYLITVTPVAEEGAA